MQAEDDAKLRCGFLIFIKRRRDGGGYMESIAKQTNAKFVKSVAHSGSLLPQSSLSAFS
jgi:hypothetical protein